MTCQSVHHFLDDLQGARMSCHDADDGSDVDRMTATNMWATAKAHGVMEDYLKNQFFEHLAIAAILARHLAVTSVLPDDNLSSKLQALESKFNKLSFKVDSFESKHNNKQGTIEGGEGSPPIHPSGRPSQRWRLNFTGLTQTPRLKRDFVPQLCSQPLYLFNPPFGWRACYTPGTEKKCAMSRIGLC